MEVLRKKLAGERLTPLQYARLVNRDNLPLATSSLLSGGPRRLSTLEKATARRLVG
jgi:hypothetical protein